MNEQDSFGLGNGTWKDKSLDSGLFILLQINSWLDIYVDVLM